MFVVITLVLLLLVIWKAYPKYVMYKRSKTKGLSAWRVMTNVLSLENIAQEFVRTNKITEGFYHMWFGLRFTMLAADAEAAKFVLKCPQFEKAPIFGTRYTGKNFGENMVSANGEVWKRHRQYVNSGFTNEAHKSYYPTFNESTEKLLKKFTENSADDVDCHSWFSKFTLDLLGKSIFHYDFGNLDSTENAYYQAYYTVLSNGGKLQNMLLALFPFLDYLPIPSITKVHDAVEKLKSLFLLVTEEHKKGKKYGDILDNLLEATEHQNALSKVEFLSNIWILFLAGHKTTATALTWACAELAQRQDIQEHLYHDIVNTFGDQPPKFDDLDKARYLDGFVHELLRLHPPASVVPTRVATEDVEYNGAIISKGTNIGLDIGSIHKNPKYWPDPLKFDPTRFFPENRKGRNNFAYLPFSLGPRQCIGNNFSLIEQKLVLTRLLQKFKVNLPKHFAPKNLSEGIPAGRTYPVYIHLEPR